MPLPMEDLELLRAALVVALADGELSRGEKGIIEGLARRVGVGRVSFDAMLAQAEASHAMVDSVLIQNPQTAKKALELLVAQARIDGEIADKERELLVRIAAALRITGDDFAAVYETGIRRADDAKNRRANE